MTSRRKWPPKKGIKSSWSDRRTKLCTEVCMLASRPAETSDVHSIVYDSMRLYPAPAEMVQGKSQSITVWLNSSRMAHIKATWAPVYRVSTPIQRKMGQKTLGHDRCEGRVCWGMWRCRGGHWWGKMHNSKWTIMIKRDERWGEIRKTKLNTDYDQQKLTLIDLRLELVIIYWALR